MAPGRYGRRVDSPSPVALEVGRYTTPRLVAGAAACAVLALSAVGITVTSGSGTIAVVVVLAIALALGAAATVFGVAAAASRGARLLVDDRGITWDARAATWNAPWDELSAVGLSVLRSGRPAGGGEGPGADRIVHVAMAFHRADADDGQAPLRRIRTAAEPAPYTHRMDFAARPGWADLLQEALAAHAGDRYRGRTVRDARGRPVAE